MEHYPALLTRAESDAAVDRIEASFDTRGFGNWAVEVPGVADFIGYVGLSMPAYDSLGKGLCDRSCTCGAGVRLFRDRPL